MSTAATVSVIVVVVLVLLVIGNVVFSALAERRNPPIGKFLEWDGVVLHYIDRGDCITNQIAEYRYRWTRHHPYVPTPGRKVVTGCKDKTTDRIVRSQSDGDSDERTP